MTTKTIVIAAFATIMWLTMILPSNLFAQTEDDGGDVFNPDDETPDEKSHREDTEHDDWENAGRPGDNDNNNDDNDDDSKSNTNDNDNTNDLPRCKLGVVKDCILNDLGQSCTFPTDVDACQDAVGGATGTPERNANGQLINKPLPYCDKGQEGFTGACHDRKDIDQKTGLYPCNDGTQKVHWRFCKDVTETKKSNNNNNNSPPQHVPDTPRTTLPSTPAPAQRTLFDLVNCKFYGAQDAVHGMDQVTYVKCLGFGSVYSDAYYDGLNAINNGVS